MDADRVRSYLQVACAGLGFDIGEVWWMSNESGTSTVASIEDPKSQSQQPNSSGQNKKPKKRFLQLYTSKAYCDQRSKLVQPHPDEVEEGEQTVGAVDGEERETIEEIDLDSLKKDDQTNGSNVQNGSSTNQLVVHPNTYKATHPHNNEGDEEEHVLSPRIVEAVTLSAQVVWANCQKQEGLLGRSDIKLQTAIGMPVGVDDGGNVWVVVMFSPNNVESSSDAIDYLQYISRSAGSTNIPCMMPVIYHHEEEHHHPREGKIKMIEGLEDHSDDDDASHHSNNSGQGSKSGDSHHSGHSQHHALVSMKPKGKPVDHTQELTEGVTAKFVSFKLSDDDNGGFATGLEGMELRNAPKDDLGIPMLPKSAQLERSPNLRGRSGSLSERKYLRQHSQEQIEAMQNGQNFMLSDSIIVADAFDEASYGVWSTIMNTASGDAIRTSETIASKMHLIRGRLEEFADAFLGMSVFDVADAWIVSSMGCDESNGATGPGNIGQGSQPPERMLKCLFTVAATSTNEGINEFRKVSGKATIGVGDGAVGTAYKSGYPVWSSDVGFIYDKSRKQALESAKIETIFAVPIFSAGDVSPSCVLSCYSLLHADSVPFVLNFVQRAVRLLWDGLDRVVNPHESVGKELWKDVGPADLGEMAADLEMQKAFIGKKRPRSDSMAAQDNRLPPNTPTHEAMVSMGIYESNEEEEHRDRSLSLASQMSIGLPSLSPAPPSVTHSLRNSNNNTFDSSINESFPSSISELAGSDASQAVTNSATLNPAASALNLLSGAASAPPTIGMGPAPRLPTTVQQCPPPQQQFVFLNPGTNSGQWAAQHVQQAVRAVGNVVSLGSVQGMEHGQNVGRSVQQGSQSQQGQQTPTIIDNSQQPTPEPVPYPQEYTPEYQVEASSTHPFAFVDYADASAGWVDRVPVAAPPTQTSQDVQPIQVLSHQQGVTQQYAPPQASPPPDLLPQYVTQEAPSLQDQQQYSAPQHYAAPVQAPQQYNVSQYAQHQATQEPSNEPQQQYVVLQPQVQQHLKQEMRPLQVPQQAQSYPQQAQTYPQQAQTYPQQLQQQSLQQQQQHQMYAEDPAVVHANLKEFNEMARAHNNNATGMMNASITPTTPGVIYQLNGNVGSNVTRNGTNGSTNGKKDNLVVIPISQAFGSVILTGPQNNMYCTLTAQPVNIDGCFTMDPTMIPSSFAREVKTCRIEGCDDIAVTKRPYCARHCGSRQCEREGCTKCAQGATRFCIAHGGGRRCTVPGCDKGARDKFFCAAHGGGKRCKYDGCSKSAVGGSTFCTSHGGGRRCQVEGCDKSAQSSTNFCVKHGGGKKCQHDGCEKVARGKTLYCAAHGGGVRCKLEGCNRVAIGKAQLCRTHGGGANSRLKPNIQQHMQYSFASM